MIMATTDSFAQFLVNEVPKFDAKLMSDIRLEGGWMSWKSRKAFDDNEKSRVDVLNKVRTIVETSVNKLVKVRLSRPQPMRVVPIRINQERFQSVYPDMKAAWK